MSDSSRRGFLKVAGAGAAAVGIGSAAQSAQAATPKVAVPAHASGGLVAHVDDVKGDSVTFFVGEREVVVHDADLVARLARAAH